MYKFIVPLSKLQTELAPPLGLAAPPSTWRTRPAPLFARLPVTFLRPPASSLVAPTVPLFLLSVWPNYTFLSDLSPPFAPVAASMASSVTLHLPSPWSQSATTAIHAAHAGDFDNQSAPCWRSAATIEAETTTPLQATHCISRRSCLC